MPSTEKKRKSPDSSDQIKLLAIDGNVPFPNIIFPVVVREERHLQLIQDAVTSDRIVGVFARKNPDDLLDESNDLFKVGVACLILKMFQSSDGSMRVLFRGLHRISLDKIVKEEPYPVARVHSLVETTGNSLKTEALTRMIADLFQQILALSPVLPEEIQEIVFSIEDPSKLSDLVTSALNLKVSEKQQILEENRITERLTILVRLLKKELKLIELNAKIHDRVSSSLNQTQREYYLREQMKAIQNELGEDEESNPELSEIRQKMNSLPLSKAVSYTHLTLPTN